MAIVLNPALPTGSRGLWWFPQGMQNLGTPATAAAEIQWGASYAGGKLTVAESSRTRMKINLPMTTQITIMCSYKKTDATLRMGGMFGFESFIAWDWSCGAFFPGSGSGGNINFLFGGYGAGNQVDTSSPPMMTDAPHVYALTTGPRGMEIWRDGVKIATNAATPTRTNYLGEWMVGQFSADYTTGDNGEFDWIFVHETQLTETLIQAISANPAGTLVYDPTAPAVPIIRQWLIPGEDRYLNVEPLGRRWLTSSHINEEAHPGTPILVSGIASSESCGIASIPLAQVGPRREFKIPADSGFDAFQNDNDQWSSIVPGGSYVVSAVGTQLDFALIVGGISAGAMGTPTVDRLDYVVHPGLPTGTVGLWWFAQGLENLGTAPTGPAQPISGATYVSGTIVHDTQADMTVMSPQASLLFPNGDSTTTIMMGFAWSDTSFRQNGTFGCNGGDVPNRLGAHFPWSDGNIYFDFGGATNGSSRVQIAITKDTAWHVWGFTVGARGMEIWRDGTKLSSHTGFTGANPSTLQWVLGRSQSYQSELCRWSWVFVHDTQLSATLIQEISADPAGKLIILETPTIKPSGIESAFAVGLVRVSRIGTVEMEGIPSGFASGIAQVSYPQAISLGGIASQEATGTWVLIQGPPPVDQVVEAVGGIASSEALDTPWVRHGGPWLPAVPEEPLPEDVWDPVLVPAGDHWDEVPTVGDPMGPWFPVGMPMHGREAKARWQRARK